MLFGGFIAFGIYIVTVAAKSEGEIHLSDPNYPKE